MTGVAMRTRTPELERATVEQAVAGDRAAQARFLEHHHAFIRATLRQLTFGRCDDFDELEQQALVAVARGLPRFAFDASASTWVRGVCANVVKDHLRRKQRRSRAYAAKRASEPAAAFLDAESTLEARETLRVLSEALEELSPAQRIAFELRVLYGHDVDEVARMMNATKTATRARLYFARRKLADRLREPSAGEADPRRSNDEAKAI